MSEKFLDVKISSDIDDVKEYLDKIKFRAFVNATRQAMNRSVTQLRTFASKDYRQRFRVKHREFTQDFSKIEKAKGSNLNTMQSRLLIRRRGPSLIRFVTGPKVVPNQKGVKIKKRAPVKVKISPSGKTIKLRGAFLAKGKSGNIHVFRRVGKTIIKKGKHTAPMDNWGKRGRIVGLAHVFSHPRVAQRLQLKGAEIFKKEFAVAFARQLALIEKRSNVLPK